MKNQYLGDSKDSFKWDYHDYLVDALGYASLNIIPMMTPDDGGCHGSSKANQYPARAEVIEFCLHIRQERNLKEVCRLPKYTSSSYEVEIHSDDFLPSESSRHDYFTGLSSTGDRIVLIDPDNGFEPNKSFSEKHLLYSELDEVLKQLNMRSVVSVFQHFRRVPFEKDFAEICGRISDGHVTAIYWHSLMFVLVSRSSDVRDRLVEANRVYASKLPVKVITNN